VNARPASHQHVWAPIREIWKAMTDDIRARLPRDGANLTGHHGRGRVKAEFRVATL
jgi:hypothetical protein